MCNNSVSGSFLLIHMNCFENRIDQLKSSVHTKSLIFDFFSMFFFFILWHLFFFAASAGTINHIVKQITVVHVIA